MTHNWLSPLCWLSGIGSESHAGGWEFETRDILTRKGGKRAKLPFRGTIYSATITMKYIYF